jgi:hypothetical protein
MHATDVPRVFRVHPAEERIGDQPVASMKSHV